MDSWDNQQEESIAHTPTSSSSSSSGGLDPNPNFLVNSRDLRHLREMERDSGRFGREESGFHARDKGVA